MFGFDRLELTDGTTTISLLDSPYSITPSGLDLGLATLRPGTLGGNGPYTDVDCTIPINITGTCPSNVYTALTAVWALLDQAQRWWKGENVSVVLLRAQASGSSVAYVEALILRRNDADAPLGLPPVYEGTVGNYTMQNVELRFTRRGEWLGAIDTASGTAQPSGNTFSVTVPDHDTISPVICNLSLPTSIAGTLSLSRSMLILTDNTANIQVVEAETATAVQFTSVAEATEQARGGSILRFTPSPTRDQMESGAFTPTLLQGTDPVAVFAVMRVSLGVNTFSMRMNFYDALNPATIAYSTVPILIQGLGVPMPVYLGSIVPPRDTGYRTMRLECSNTTVSAILVLDIDYLVFVKVTDVLTTIAFPVPFGIVAPPYTAGTVMRLRADHQANTALAPFVGICTSANAQRTSITHSGPSFPVMRDTTLAGIWLSMGSATGTTNRWRFTDAADALYSNTPTAERRRGYLTLP